MELLDERPIELMSGPELVAALDQHHADLARIETRWLRLLAALDTTGYAERVGARDTVQFVEYRYRLDHHRARRDVHLARALPKYAAVTTALPGGALDDAGDGGGGGVRLRPAQAEAIVLELEKAPSTVPVADLECAEAELVRLARHLPPADLRKAAIQARDILDTDGPEPEEHKAAARETLTLTNADRGVKFGGYLANENAELIRSVIIAGARPHKTLDGEPDPRSREKRQADALTAALTMAAAALDAGTPSPTIPRPGTPATTPQATDRPAPSGEDHENLDHPAGTAATAADDATSSPAGNAASLSNSETATTGTRPSASGRTEASRGDVVPGFGAKANITVTIDLEDLKAATADAIGQTVYSNGLSAATIRRLACDANVIPIVLGSNSEPLDVGRRERLVTKGMRRALNTRDKGCVVCGAPPIMCDAHHLRSWIYGGVTAVSNLVLLCRRHHADLHNGHWTVTITNGIVHVARPHWADPPPLSRLSPGTASPSDPADVGRPAAPKPDPDRTAARRPTAGRPIADPPTAGPADPADPHTASPDEAAVRDATYRAIWGEDPPPDPQATPATPLRGHPDSLPIDPWAETADAIPPTTAPTPT